GMRIAGLAVIPCEMSRANAEVVQERMTTRETSRDAGHPASSERVENNLSGRCVVLDVGDDGLGWHLGGIGVRKVDWSALDATYLALERLVRYAMKIVGHRIVGRSRPGEIACDLVSVERLEGLSCVHPGEGASGLTLDELLLATRRADTSIRRVALNELRREVRRRRRTPPGMARCALEVFARQAYGGAEADACRSCRSSARPLSAREAKPSDR